MRQRLLLISSPHVEHVQGPGSTPMNMCVKRKVLGAKGHAQPGLESDLVDSVLQ